MLLAIDTSAGTAVAAVADDGRVVAERSSDDTRRHAELIGPFLAEVIAAAEVDGARLSHVVAGIGPGPFTGLRVGIAAARAVALARGIPLLAVPSHEAVALRLVEGGVAAGRFAVITDARRREVAVTVFAAGLPLPAVVEPAHLVARAAFAPADGVTPYEAHEIPAASLAHAALARLASGAAFPEPRPLYLRAPDVTLSTPKRVS
ncbi:tRNA (adenosine(37)-N6)-threonylcarbamoyltransferase complex dimerization subunit type 1 TsaB [Microcella alkalica]|uniref:tRNA (adenosine(37)-N6)-threonylcarbamoyltransferase complex dimerization subunit type 1 TsaB n=1 Tax=Microcella alkalica TaxID=355930 RepID=UPI00145E131C|nr:tRNA (adenosine(37)-N6)-threonylcarbamoyltransferase complex dimerization subunit type 1 TsaB [Microcella alkalica]